MNTKSDKSSSSLTTRRSALGLVLAGVTIPALPALAGKEFFTRFKPHANSPIRLTTCSGETFTALFDSDLLVGTGGSARGFMSFTFGTDVIEYVAEHGGLDFDSAGKPIRAVVLLSRRGSSGKDAHDFMLATVAPDPLLPADCLIYTTVGPDVHVEPVRFEVPGTWEER